MSDFETGPEVRMQLELIYPGEMRLESTLVGSSYPAVIIQINQDKDEDDNLTGGLLISMVAGGGDVTVKALSEMFIWLGESIEEQISAGVIEEDPFAAESDDGPTGGDRCGDLEAAGGPAEELPGEEGDQPTQE